MVPALQKLEASGKLKGDKPEGKLETSWSMFGFDFKESWSLDSKVTFEGAKKDFLADHKSKAVLEAKLHPASGLEGLTFKSNAEIGAVHADIKLSGANIPKALDAAAVYGTNVADLPLAVGLKVSTKNLWESTPAFTSQLAVKAQPTSNQFLYVNYGLDKGTIESAIYNKTDKMDFGAKVNYDNGSTKITGVTSYALDATSTLKVRLDSKQNFDLATVHKVGVATISPSVAFSNGGAPGVGFSIKLSQ